MQKKAGGVAQVAECLLSKLGVMSSNTVPPNKIKNINEVKFLQLSYEHFASMHLQILLNILHIPNN
jgi:hypothetical protein